MTSFHIFDDPPSRLYRVFDCLEYAKTFCAGSVRFKTIESYRKIENNIRADASEGIAKLSVPGESILFDVATNKMHIAAGKEIIIADTFEDSHFILCLTMPQKGRYPEKLNKFGKYLVTIHEPKFLISRLADALQKEDEVNKNPPVLEAGTVIYNKDSNQVVKPDLTEINRLRWKQKPSSFQIENEYRVHLHACWLNRSPINDCLWLKIPEGIGSYSIDLIKEY